MNWNIYLAGEIHTPWRDDLRRAVEKTGLPVTFLSPVTDHSASDNCGVAILGEEDSPFWKDHKGAMLNAIRTRTLLRKSDLVVVKFGEKYRQWNAAFDAGYAAALGKPVVVIHDESLTHALKEVAAAALAVAKDPSQVADILRYAIMKE